MRCDRRATWRLDVLETRSLLSVTVVHAVPPPPSAAVQADIAKINQDQKTLRADMIRLAPTLQQDQLAINAAIRASATVQAAQVHFQTDQTTWWNLLQADSIAFARATTAAAQKAALTKLQTDQTHAVSVFQTDAQAVQTATNNDPNVQAAVAKLAADSAPISADNATLAADQAQLIRDQNAPPAPPPPVSGPVA
jgi:hypothetical protein